MSNVGFIGLGKMGAPMAGHLQSGGHTLFVNTRSAVPDALKSGGATVCDNPKVVAQQADIIILMVPDTPDVDKVLFGANGVSEGLTRGKIVVDMSSISPVETKRLRSRAEGIQVYFTGTQNDILIRKMFAPGAVSDRKASPMSTRVLRISEFDLSSCHTT